MDDNAAAAVKRFLTLTLGGEFFALDIFTVREILDYTDITRIPQTPPYMRGVVNVRGNAVPVVDLGAKLGFGEVTRTMHTRIVIVEVRHPDGQLSLMGALADSVKEVLELDTTAIAPPPSLGASGNATGIQGIGRQGDRFILLLDAQEVFGTDAILNLDAVLGERGTDNPPESTQAA